MKTKILILGLAALLSGCATGSHVLTGTARPAISPESVMVYSAAPANSETIAILNATANSLKIDSCVEQLKKDAASLGANGVVITASEAHYMQGARVSGTAIFVK